MTFNPNIPAAGDKPSQSQEQLLTNFAALNTVFAVDHLAFNAVAGGEHQQVTFNNVVADPGLADPKCSLYTKTIAGDSELFFEKYDNAAVANLVQQISNIVPTTQVYAGPAPLPIGTLYAIQDVNGAIYTWGRLIIPAGTTNTGNLTFPISYAGHNQAVTVTIENVVTQIVGVANILGPTFQLIRSAGAGAVTVNVIAIG